MLVVFPFLVVLIVFYVLERNHLDRKYYSAIEVLIVNESRIFYEGYSNTSSFMGLFSLTLSITILVSSMVKATSPSPYVLALLHHRPLYLQLTPLI